MDGVLQDRVAIITGGAQGLGEAICRRLAREGAHVVVVFLASDQASYMTGQAVNVTGGQEMH
jgi:NAD(P)-dependent dehydrogenase (short-subunit alcohol dehydrogenase family)